MRLKSILNLASALLLSATAAKALDVNANVTTQKGYNGRGFKMADHVVVQPCLTLSHDVSSVTASVTGFGNVSSESKKLNEADFMANVSTSVSGVNIGIGYGNFHFPNTDSDPTQEVSASLNLPVFLNPSMLGVYDFMDKGGYLEFSVQESKQVGPLTLTGKLALGENIFYFTEMHGPSHLLAGISASYTLPHGLSLTAKAERTLAANKDFNSTTVLSLGVNASF
jgi:hypothetical protein